MVYSISVRLGEVIFANPRQTAIFGAALALSGGGALVAAEAGERMETAANRLVE
jgi:hypothetical protein